MRHSKKMAFLPTFWNERFYREALKKFCGLISKISIKKTGGYLI